MILMKVAKKIAQMLKMIENPMLLSLQRRGIPIDVFTELNQPWIVGANINTVFDIGAHKGQFAVAIHEVLPAAKIYCFEPLEDCYEHLKKRIEGLSNIIAFGIALSDNNGELEFYRNEYSQSSSALPMADLHKQNFPFANREYLTKVKTARLDDVATCLEIKPNILIKMDTQGFEYRVISGGRNIVKQATVLIIETSFQHLYLGQPLFEDIYDCLKEDFKYMGALEQTVSPIEGSVLFEDSIFLNRSNRLFD